MAKSRKSSGSMFSGSRIFMLLFGLILGLGIAAGVAWFVTQVPMPFTDNFSRADPTKPLPDPHNAPDPNRGLSGRPDPDSKPAEAGAKPATGGDGVSLQDDIGALLTTLGAPTTGGTTAPAPVKPATPPATGTASQTTYYLQAGAFKAEADAQAMQARILMAGMQSTIQPAQVNGTTLYRVRVGPFKGIDAMNKSRATLSKAKIETSVVRP